MNILYWTFISLPLWVPACAFVMFATLDFIDVVEEMTTFRININLK